jgi:ankyrin repeat protein
VLARTEENLKDEEKSLFDWCKEGNVEKIRELLNPDNINHQDEDGLTLMHWASDRGHSTVVRLLVERGANLNIQDVDGQAPLHYASSCGHQDIVTFLIAAGADVNIKDNNLDTPRAVAMDTSIERLFA